MAVPSFYPPRAFPEEAVGKHEVALAYPPPSMVVQAYQRSDVLEARRDLMNGGRLSRQTGGHDHQDDRVALHRAARADCDRAAPCVREVVARIGLEPLGARTSGSGSIRTSV